MTNHDKRIDSCWFRRATLTLTIFKLLQGSPAMTSETNKVKAKLAALSASFDDLEAELEPLFSQTLPETIIGLESIQKAKLQTVLPYLVYDLIFSRSPWVLLRKMGLDVFFSSLSQVEGHRSKDTPRGARVGMMTLIACRFPLTGTSTGQNTTIFWKDNKCRKSSQQ